MSQDTLYINLIAKHLSGNTTQKEQAQLDNWLAENAENKAFFEQAKKSWELTETYAEEVAFSPSEKVWAQFESKLDQSSEQRPQKGAVRRFNFRRLAAAAAILIIGTLAVYWFVDQNQNSPISPPLYVEHNTGTAETSTIELPDGSKVILNQNSQLKYLAGFENRQIELNGEAFFEVTKQNGKTFEVLSSNSKTVVLGTSFNVRAYPKDTSVEVSVISGKVAFVTKQETQKDSILLTPGDFVNWNKKASKIEKKQLDNKNAISWKTNQLDFEDSPLKETLHALERHFGVAIQPENSQLNDCLFTGKFDTTSLSHIFEAMEFALGVKVEKEDSAYTISGAGCQ